MAKFYLVGTNRVGIRYTSKYAYSNPVGFWRSIQQVEGNNILFSVTNNKRRKFNDALNTFYLLLYGVGHMVKNHSPTVETLMDIL